MSFLTIRAPRLSYDFPFGHISFDSHLHKAHQYFEREVTLTLVAFASHRTIRAQWRLGGFGLAAGGDNEGLLWPPIFSTLPHFQQSQELVNHSKDTEPNLA